MKTSSTSAEHKAKAPLKLGVYVLTCSTSRYRDRESGRSVEDPSGDMIANHLTKAGHTVIGRKLVPDNEAIIKQTLREILIRRDIDAVIMTGGTGISPKDVTIEVARDLFEKDIPGFGELFRKISYDEIGSPAILTRAVAGVAKSKLIFCLPGSPDAVNRAMASLIVPEIGHMVKHIRES